MPLALLNARPDDLKDRSFSFCDLAQEGGRCELYEPVQTKAQYVLGLDFALGIPGRDWDTACVFRRSRQPPYPQVFEAQGHWGPLFDRIIYAIHRYFNDCFILGEANNTGTMILSRLFHEYAATNMYGDRDETKKMRAPLKRLGCWKGTGAIVLPKFRRAVLDRSVLLRSRPLLAQMADLQFAPRNAQHHETAVDDDLKVKVASGGSPDLVMAGSYAYHAIEEVHYFEEPEPEAPYGSIGDILGYNQTWEDEKKGKGWRARR